MEKKMHYHLAFMQGAISYEDAKKYISLLEEETLNQITHMSFDRRLLKPIMETAWNNMENADSMDFNCEVSDIINNKKKMFSLMKRYCVGK